MSWRKAKINFKHNRPGFELNFVKNIFYYSKIIHDNPKFRHRQYAKASTYESNHIRKNYKMDKDD